MISVHLPTHTSCVRFSPNQELLLLCCIDGTVMIYDQIKSTSTSVKAAFVGFISNKFHINDIQYITRKCVLRELVVLFLFFFKIPTLTAWHSDGIIFVVGNDRGQFQHFDITLTCIKSQTLSDETTPANILDLSSYFRYKP